MIGLDQLDPARVDETSSGRAAMPEEMVDRTSGGPGSPGTERAVLKAQDDLWAEALSLAAVVESTFATSVTALCHHRPELAAEVKAGEREIDRREVAIEKECLRVLALYEPVASDFRRVLTILRVNRDLERIGDLAARIAKRARKLGRRPRPVPIPEPLEALAEAAMLSLRDALDSLVNRDALSGRSVIARDHRLDEYRRTVRAGLKEAMRQDVDRIEDWLQLMDVARHLERVGDHAAGIAESVIYLKEGRIIRHDGGLRRKNLVDPDASS
jgi:phosphate transport system protein